MFQSAQQRLNTGRAPLPISLACLMLLVVTHPAIAQTTPPAKATDGQIVTSASQAPNDDQPPPVHDPSASPAQRLEEAWSMLNTAVIDPKHVDTRIQALGALGTMGTNPRSLAKISDALDDTNLDVRTAALLAAGQTRAVTLTTKMRALLDDKEPQVAFTAAVTLWKMNDRSGEDILLAVAGGDRSANPTLAKGAQQGIARTLRSPANLARFGALQGAAMLLGPFGFGITAVEYMRRNGGDSARVTAIEQLSQQKNGPIKLELIDALTDKDLAVRAAAARALGNYHDPSVSGDLFKLFLDPKPPVRLTAAAAYINSTQAAPAPARRKPTRP